MSGFRWHSCVVDQGLQPSAAPAAPPPPAEPAAPKLGPAQTRHIENSYSAVMLALKQSKRDGAGKISEPASVLRGGGRGRATGRRCGHAACNRRPGHGPSLDDYATLCVLTPGTQISSAVAPHVPAALVSARPSGAAPPRPSQLVAADDHLISSRGRWAACRRPWPRRRAEVGCVRGIDLV